MYSFKETLDIIRQQTSRFPATTCSLNDLNNRILAQDVFADRDYPPFNRVAMDGIAIRFNDWEKGIREFRVRKTIYAGQGNFDIARSGDCFTIMTGAACPESVDTIVRKEDLRFSGDIVEIVASSITPYQNIAKKGEDCRFGNLVVSAGTRCNPPVIAMLAALGLSEVAVFDMPTTALVTTGSEVVDVYQKVEPYQIRNSNRYLLLSMLSKWNIVPELTVHVADARDALYSELEQALTKNLVLINGGISAGDADYVLSALQDLGVEILISRVAIRPGKPVTIGRTKRGTFIFALPGNPMSCMVTFLFFVESYLINSCGIANEVYPVGRIGFERENKSGLDEFFPVQRGVDGVNIEVIRCNGSGDISATLDASAFGWHPKEIKQLIPGQYISFKPF